MIAIHIWQGLTGFQIADLTIFLVLYIGFILLSIVLLLVTRANHSSTNGRTCTTDKVIDSINQNPSSDSLIK